MAPAPRMLSVFIREPEFQGQTKDRLASAEAARIVESALRDAFDHWLDRPPEPGQPPARMGDRARRGAAPPPAGEGDRPQDGDAQAAAARQARRLRASGAQGTELFIVEGDSAGGSAKQARDRATQAILPLRGKILNVASAGRDKLADNQQLADLIQALGCGTGARYREEDLRYEQGRHHDRRRRRRRPYRLAAHHLLLSRDAGLIDAGHLYLAVPPLYRLEPGRQDRLCPRRRAQGRADDERSSTARARSSVSRFKGLGEMLPKQLKETTMDPAMRTLLRVEHRRRRQETTGKLVEQLMGNKPEARFAFIQERAEFAKADELDI